MSREAVRGYDDLTQEEIELITDTVRRRIGGMFLRARHPKFRNKKGTRRSSAGSIIIHSRDAERLITHVKKNISRRGALSNAAITNRVIRKVVIAMIMEGEVWYAGDAWNMNASLMSLCREQSQRLSDEARARKSAEKMNRGFVPPVQRQRRRAVSVA